MPFKSKAQQRWMYAKHPEMAHRWAEHTPDMSKLPEKKKAEIEKKGYEDVLKMAGVMESPARSKLMELLAQVKKDIPGAKIPAAFHEGMDPEVAHRALGLVGTGHGGAMGWKWGGRVGALAGGLSAATSDNPDEKSLWGITKGTLGGASLGGIGGGMLGGMAGGPAYKALYPAHAPMKTALDMQTVGTGLNVAAGLASFIPGVGTAGGAALGAIGGAGQALANGEGIKGIATRGALGGAVGAIPGGGLANAAKQTVGGMAAGAVGDKLNAPAPHPQGAKPPLQPYG